MKDIIVGQSYRFEYPNFGAPDCHPDYTAHRDQAVTVIREMQDGVEYDNPRCVNEDGTEEGGDRMFKVRAADGWEGDAWESELEPLA